MEDTRFGMDYIKKVRGKSDPRAGTESSKGGGALGRFTWGSKKSLGSQKVAKRKPKKKDEMSIQEQGKLRKKKEKMEAEGKANIKKDKESKKLWGDWFNVSPEKVSQRLKSAKTKKKKKSKGSYDDIWDAYGKGRDTK